MHDDTTRCHEIVLIAVPRSGTNFFCECLGAFPEIVGLFEIFNPKGAFGLKQANILPALGKELGVPLTDVSQPEVVDFFKNKPLVALDFISDVVESSGHTAFSYKIFPGQLDASRAATLFAAPHRHLIFLVRRRLDVFISYEKARLQDVWKNQSTAETKPEIEVDKFLKWSKRADDWYASCIHLAQLHKRPYTVLAYDTDVDLPKAELIGNLTKLLDSYGIAVTPPAADIATKFRRQDLQVGPFKKISNGEELRAELRARKKYNYALGVPLFS